MSAADNMPDLKRAQNCCHQMDTHCTHILPLLLYIYIYETNRFEDKKFIEINNNNNNLLVKKHDNYMYIYVKNK